jgi:2-keto-4-pentenoate hydratase/2-oxohepta-3-ene-1,7-dioic acid hydratase in catechol pathway
MRVLRYQAEQGAAYGIAVDGLVHELAGGLFDHPVPGRVVGELETLTLLAPCEPSKVICVGRNYHGLLAMQGRQAPEQPFLFLKAPNAVIGPDAQIRRPGGVERLIYEAELAVVIGRALARPSAGGLAPLTDWQSFVLGYVCGNDVTALDWQDPTVQWARAKSSDTMCPLGPWIETDPGDPHDLSVRAYVNGVLAQDGSTSDMHFDIPTLLAYIASAITLLPGDVVLTGTPPGAAALGDGDLIEVEVEGIGRLANRVTAGR